MGAALLVGSVGRGVRAEFRRSAGLLVFALFAIFTAALIACGGEERASRGEYALAWCRMQAYAMEATPDGWSNDRQILWARELAESLPRPPSEFESAHDETVRTLEEFTDVINETPKERRFEHLVDKIVAARMGLPEHDSAAFTRVCEAHTREGEARVSREEYALAWCHMVEIMDKMDWPNDVQTRWARRFADSLPIPPNEFEVIHYETVRALVLLADDIDSGSARGLPDVPNWIFNKFTFSTSDYRIVDALYKLTEYVFAVFARTCTPPMESNQWSHRWNYLDP